MEFATADEVITAELEELVMVEDEVVCVEVDLGTVIVL